MTNNAAKLYNIISEDKDKKQSLFRIALTNPKSALEEICKIGEDLNIKVSKEEALIFKTSPILQISSKADFGFVNAVRNKLCFFSLSSEIIL